MTVVVRRPGGPLAGLVTSITYRTGEQPRTSVEKILPSPETGLWVNLNRDAFRSFGWSGDVHQVPGTMVSGPAGHAVVMEFEEGHVTMSSPIGRALLGKKVGEIAYLKLPTMVRQLKVTELQTIHDQKPDDL